MLRTITLLCLVVFPAASRAAEMSFPYEAIVAGEDVVVRSGPGKNYYATSKLERDQHVTVHRHDPGGWFMITPPAGSISWIESSLVEKSGNRGVVSVPADASGAPGQAIVRIGSTLSDDHGYTGRRLSTGEEVEILGEQTLATKDGPVRMLQIVPPAREYRWVKGDFIVPADAALRRHADSDPYAIPSHHRGTQAAAAIERQMPDLPSLTKSNKKTASADDEVISTVSTPSHQQRMQLLEIDNQFADMMTKDVSQWQLGTLRASYEALKAQAEPVVAHRIDSRLASLAEREKMYSAYAKLTQITATTEQRDAELLGLAPPTAAVPSATMNVVVTAPGMAPPAAATFTAPSPTPGMIMPTSPNGALAVQLGTPRPTPPGLMAAPTPALIPVPGNSGSGVMQASGVQAAGGSSGVVPASGMQTAATPKLVGAGIVQATNLRGAGVPQYMLTAADGKFLAFLDSSTMDLRAYIGKSMGVTGTRAHEPRLRGDLIQAQQLTPVVLSR